MLERNDFFFGSFWRTSVEVHHRASCVTTRRARHRAERAPRLPVNRTRNIAGAKSFADDLNKERGIVRSRVVLLLRSSEIKPLFSDLSRSQHAARRRLLLPHPPRRPPQAAPADDCRRVDHATATWEGQPTGPKPNTSGCWDGLF